MHSGTLGDECLSEPGSHQRGAYDLPTLTAAVRAARVRAVSIRREAASCAAAQGGPEGRGDEETTLRETVLPAWCSFEHAGRPASRHRDAHVLVRAGPIDVVVARAHRGVMA